MTIRPTLLALLLLVAAIRAFGDGAAPLPHETLQVLPETRILYSWQRERCGDWDIPDTPARAWRGPDGSVTLIAGAETSRASVGPGLDDLQRDCAPRLTGPGNPDPAALSDRWWIASVHARADGTIEALVHAEYHGHAHPGACDLGQYRACWRNAILAAESRDGGRSFRVATDTPVAALPYPYDRAQTARSGYFSPSNMIERDGYLYALVFAAAYREQAGGVCLLRRPLDGGASAWRAWDGTDFALRLDGREDKASGGCRPLEGVTGNLTSVVARGGSYLAVSPMARRDESGQLRSGFWALTSGDLIHWSAPVLLMERPLLWKPDCAMPYSYAYPAFLDPGSPDANFATVSDRFWLTFVRLRLGPDCRPGPERDLMAREIHWPEDPAGQPTTD